MIDQITAGGDYHPRFRLLAFHPVFDEKNVTDLHVHVFTGPGRSTAVLPLDLFRKFLIGCVLDAAPA